MPDRPPRLLGALSRALHSGGRAFHSTLQRKARYCNSCFSPFLLLRAEQTGERGRPFLQMLDIASIVFQHRRAIMKVAPIGAFGAMAFTIGKYGVASLISSLGKLLLTFYVTCLLSSLFSSGPWPITQASVSGASSQVYKEELLVVPGTSSSESVLPRMITKMEVLGCEESVVGLVIPTGYSFRTLMAVALCSRRLRSLSLRPRTRRWIFGTRWACWQCCCSRRRALLKSQAPFSWFSRRAFRGRYSSCCRVPLFWRLPFLVRGRSADEPHRKWCGTIYMAKLGGSVIEERMREVLNHETAIEADEPEKVLVT